MGEGEGGEGGSTIQGGGGQRWMAVGGFQKLDGGSIHIRNLIKEQAAQTIPGSAEDPLPPGAIGVAGVSNERRLCVFE